MVTGWTDLANQTGSSTTFTSDRKTFAMAEPKEGILLTSGNNEVEFIEFYLAGVSYGINVSKVQKVIELKSIKVTPMLQAPSSVLGTFHLQDKPVALIHLAEALNIATHGQEAERQLILVATFNRMTTGYVIDGIHKIHRTSWKQFQPMKDDFSIQDSTAGGYVTGTIEMDGRVILVLDLERLMLDYYPDYHRPVELVEEPQADVKTKREQLNIVYAEDSRMVRAITEETLLKAGFTGLKSFEDGQKAYDYIIATAETAREQGKVVSDYIDMIITDIEMPQMDGLTLCKQVKGGDAHMHIPAVVVYSSLITREMAQKCKAVGADDQLSKPHGDEIVAVIDHLCLGIKPPTSESVAVGGP